VLVPTGELTGGELRLVGASPLPWQEQGKGRRWLGRFRLWAKVSLGRLGPAERRGKGDSRPDRPGLGRGHEDGPARVSLRARERERKAAGPPVSVGSGRERER
jgi:hypothetical protein